MMLYHVTSVKKLEKYLASGHIKAPVRAWKSIAAAERFSKQTGRRVILRLKSDETFTQYEGHRGEAVVSDKNYVLRDI